MVLIYGFPILFYVVALLGAIVPMPIVFRFLHDYQRNRILSFIHPTADVSGTSYNSIQALISIGSGGISGKGFGQATQSVLKFLPERHTDFIFATISESLGLIGGVVILFLFILLLSHIYRIAVSSRDQFSYLISLGFFFVLFFSRWEKIFNSIGGFIAIARSQQLGSVRAGPLDDSGQCEWRSGDCGYSRRFGWVDVFVLGHSFSAAVGIADDFVVDHSDGGFRYRVATGGHLFGRYGFVGEGAYFGCVGGFCDWFG
jgi:hypothetical protein